MHEAKYRWALECIRDSRYPYEDLTPERLAELVLASSEALDLFMQQFDGEKT